LAITAAAQSISSVVISTLRRFTPHRFETAKVTRQPNA
jgi:hypothetical protein